MTVITTSVSNTHSAARPAELAPQQIRRILIGVLIPAFLASLDQTIVATALPVIGQEFDSASSVAWVVSAYMLVFTLRFVGCLLALISLGAGSLFTTTMNVVLNASERRDIGSSTGFMLFARQLSAALVITAVGAWVLGAPVNEGGRSLPVWPFQQVFVAAAAGFAIALVFILVIKARPLRDS
jgi:MFS family permease